MIRFAGRIEPGSGGGVFTGQSVLFRPARMALTSAMLSLRVRFATDGTVIGGSFTTVSFMVATVLDEVISVPTTGTIAVGVEVAEAITPAAASAVVASGGPPGGTTSSDGVAPASRLAAHPEREAKRPKTRSSEADLYRSIDGKRIDEMRLDGSRVGDCVTH